MPKTLEEKFLVQITEIVRLRGQSLKRSKVLVDQYRQTNDPEMFNKAQVEVTRGQLFREAIEAKYPMLDE